MPSLLAPGLIATMKRYPETFKIPVYPTHRSAIYPDYVYETAKKQAPEVELADGGNGILNLGTSTIPFPFPTDAIQVYWNHATRYRQHGNLIRTYTQTPVQANGKFEPVVFKETASWAPKLVGNDNSNLLFTFMQVIRISGAAQGRHSVNSRIHRPGQTASQRLGLQPRPAPCAPRS